MEGNQSLSEIVTALCRTFFDYIGNISSLVVVEIQQVKWSLVQSVLLLVTAMILVSFTWLGICIIICIFLAMYGLGLLASILCVTALNCILMVITIIYILNVNKKTFFSGTTRQLGLAINHGKDGENE